ncbi:MAG: DUF192 domain-containing protein [Candidatus Aenigmarchaeota archaeon]|nr:DUF192 domain-containing protein [Candidatus Aenigmarchaeota archaeon]
MKIINATKKTVVAERTEVAKSEWQKTKGLMFRDSLAKNAGLLMKFPGETKPGIWMPFMRFPIDIIFISAEKKVVDMKEKVLPISRHPKTWRIYVPKAKCKWVIEVSAGRARETKTKIGDELRF